MADQKKGKATYQDGYHFGHLQGLEEGHRKGYTKGWNEAWGQAHREHLVLEWKVVDLSYRTAQQKDAVVLSHREAGWVRPLGEIYNHKEDELSYFFRIRRGDQAQDFLVKEVD